MKSFWVKASLKILNLRSVSSNGWVAYIRLTLPRITIINSGQNAKYIFKIYWQALETEKNSNGKLEKG